MLDFDALNPIMFKNCGWFPAQKKTEASAL